MEFKQFLVLLKGLKAVYTKDNFLPDEDSVKIWYSLLKDIPYDVLNVAIQKYILTAIYPPTIAELRRLSSEIVQGQQPDWGESWEKVQKAVRRYGMYRPEEAMQSMDEITRKCVERIGFKNICLSENISVERANFRMIYENLVEREKQDAQIPKKIKTLIDSMKMNDKMIEGSKE